LLCPFPKNQAIIFDRTSMIVNRGSLMKRNQTFFAALLLALLTAFSASAQTASPKHKAIFQLTEPQGADWDVLFAHVNNLKAALDEDGGVQVEVVFFGQGLNMLRKSNAAYAERLKQLSDKGVTIAACKNAMKLLNLKTEDLFPFAIQVDAGVAELVRKQEAGFAYIH
jgi:intracellular sulfur oxidation DsrE/DsrF family protein